MRCSSIVNYFGINTNKLILISITTKNPGFKFKVSNKTQLKNNST